MMQSIDETVGNCVRHLVQYAKGSKQAIAELEEREGVAYADVYRTNGRLFLVEIRTGRKLNVAKINDLRARLRPGGEPRDLGDYYPLLSEGLTASDGRPLAFFGATAESFVYERAHELIEEEKDPDSDLMEWMTRLFIDDYHGPYGDLSHYGVTEEDVKETSRFLAWENKKRMSYTPEGS